MHEMHSLQQSGVDLGFGLVDIDSNAGEDSTSPRYNFVIKEGGVEAEEGDGVRDDIYFEGDSNNLVRGETSGCSFFG